MAIGDHIPHIGARAEHGERSLLYRLMLVRKEIPQAAVQYALAHRQDHTAAAAPEAGQVIDLEAYRRGVEAGIGKSAVAPETDGTIDIHEAVPGTMNEAYMAALEAVDEARKEAA